MSLYRKYRPASFADVTGQDHIVTTLEQAVKQEKLAHAYLFAGARGTGKTSVARILAKSLLIRGMADDTLQQQVARGVEEGTIVDLIEIDAASNRGIDDIRSLVEKIQFSPVVAGAKVYIIDEVHMLTKEAFNALLKTLEEPPAYAYFILATTELQKIPATIQSRCQRFLFRHIGEEDIVRRLQYICDAEKITADRPALRAIAHHAQGGMRDAISLLDQLRSLPKIDALSVKERMGETGIEHVESVFAALASGDRAHVLELVKQVEEAGVPLDTFTRQLLSAVRTQLHQAVTAGTSTEQFSRMLGTLLQAIRDIRIAPVPGLVLEAALLTLCEGSPRALAAVATPARTQQTEAARPAKAPKAVETVTTEAMAVPEEKPTAAPEAPHHVPTVEASELTLQSVLLLWPTLLDEASPAALKMSLKNGRVTEVTEKGITVSFTSKFHRDRVGTTEASHTIEHLLERHLKRTVRMHCVVDQGASPVPSDTPQIDLAEAVAEIF